MAAGEIEFVNLTEAVELEDDDEILVVSPTATPRARRAGMAALSGKLLGGGSDRLSLALRSHGFIRDMAKPLREFRTPGQGFIQVGRYPPSYLGVIEGTFSAVGSPTTPATPITVGAPTGVIPNTYRGMIFGQTNSASPAATQVRVFKNGVAQPTAYATPDGSGFFACDLSAVDLGAPDGPWTLRVYRAGVAEGNPWPQVAVYSNTTIALEVITDTTYTITTMLAPYDGRFSFDVAPPGEKQITLKIGADIIAQDSPVPGLVRSYLTDGFPTDGTRFETLSYVYDHAIALLAAIAIGDFDLSEELMIGLMKCQDEDGRFYFSRQQEGTSMGEALVRTGAHALATYAGLKWCKSQPGNPYPETDYLDALKVSVDYVVGLISASGPTSGLVLGGEGIYEDVEGEEVLDPDAQIEWASTEHNIDSYFLLRLADQLYAEDYGTTAEALGDTMVTKLWDAVNTRLRQGIQPGGNDDAWALDCQTWGAIFLQAHGEPVKAQQNFAEAERYRFTVTGPDGPVTGYHLSYDHAGYPDIAENVWAEGTFGWIYAAERLHLSNSYEMGEILKMHRVDGSFPYVLVEDEPWELYPYPAIIGSAWGILAALGRGIWDD